VIFVMAALAPVLTGLGGAIYLGVSALGGLGFIALAVRLFFSRAGDAVQEQAAGLYDVKPGAKHARNLFAFSIAYLTLLFAALLAERLLALPALRP
jgi:heme o synthase